MSTNKNLNGIKKVINETILFMDWIQTNISDNELHNDIHHLIMKDERMDPLDFAIDSSKLAKLKGFLEKEEYSLSESIELFTISQEVFKSFTTIINQFKSDKIPEFYLHAYLGALFFIYIRKKNIYAPVLIHLMFFIQATTNNDDELAKEYSLLPMLPRSTYEKIGKFFTSLFQSPSEAWATIHPFLKAILIEPKDTVQSIISFFKRDLVEIAENNDVPFLDEILNQQVSFTISNPNDPAKQLEFDIKVESASPLKIVSTINGTAAFQNDLNEEWTTESEASLDDFKFILDHSSDNPMSFSFGNLSASFSLISNNGNELKLVFKEAGQSLALGINGSGSLLKEWKRDWKTKVKADANFDMSFDPELSGNIAQTKNGGFLIDLAHKKEISTENIQKADNVSGSRFDTGSMELQLQLSNTGFKAFGILKDCKLVIDPSEGDGFLSSIISVEESINFDFGFEIGYNKSSGYYLKGSMGQEVRIPLFKSIGPLTFRDLFLTWSLGNQEQSGLAAEFTTSIDLKLGAFTGTVEHLGFKAGIVFPENGPIALSLGYKPPTGMSLSLDASIVKGGGYLFFDPEKEEYGGVLDLVLANKIGVVATGLLTTRFPDNSKGFSLLLIISAEFRPGIALGMGFFLNGIGGIIGLHRTVNTEALRLAVKQGSVDDVMFPTDVIVNIQRVITDLREFFPPQRDQFIVGLMAKITWGVPTLLTVEFGIIVEFSKPTRLVILGVVKLVLPSEDKPIIRIQVNFLGVVDFDEEYLMFDASLFDSRLLNYTLDGDMALRVFWGKQKEFLLSVGGFHPAYSPPSFLKVGNLTRLTLNLLSGNPRLTLTTYIAITSNTVQFGALIDFSFKISKFKVTGHFGFDLLFQFSPFHFIANVSAGVKVQLGNKTLFAIQLSFELHGPTPWIVQGTARFKVLFFDFHVKFSTIWGERRDTILPKIAILPKIIEALEQPRNWIGEIPSNKFLLTTLKEVKLGGDEVITHSIGVLTIRQTIIPLEIEFTKFGNSVPLDIKKATISNIRVDGDKNRTALERVKDSFAPAQFREMEDNDRLSAPSYKDEVSGVKLDAATTLDLNYIINRPVEYEVLVSDYDPEFAKRFIPYIPLLQPKLFVADLSNFKKMASGGNISHSDLSRELNKKRFLNKNAVRLEPECYVIVDKDNLTRMQSTVFEYGSKAEANDFLMKKITENPKLKNHFQIIPEYELIR